MKPSYDDIKHKLDSKMIEASSLEGQQAQNFVTSTFQWVRSLLDSKQISHKEYVRLINHLANYKNGSFNDYIDLLAGAAQLGQLNVLAAKSQFYNAAEQARRNSQQVTKLTGMEPYNPQEEK